MKKPLVIIAGPTAVGKTDTAIKLALQINGEIISADSMQIYKYMNIGTAKPSKEELSKVKHFLIDELYPDEEYSVAMFQKKAKTYIAEIYEKGKIPIIAGGTGFYINSVLYGTEFKEAQTETDFRSGLSGMNPDQLYEMLMEIDPRACESIHKNNVKRVIRAIEFYKQTGTPISEHNQREKARKPAYSSIFFTLYDQREVLYQRINERVDVMVEAGLVDEVKGLLEMGYHKDLVSMQGLGYKEIVLYLEGELTMDEAIDLLKKSTRHFAKRQLTWFRNKTDSIWVKRDEVDIDEMAEKIKRLALTSTL